MAGLNEQPESRPVSMFAASVNDLIDVNEENIAATLYHRLPEKLLVALYVVALFSCFVQGHNGGLRRTRVPLAAVIVGITLAMMITIIVDIDRPWHGGIPVDQEPLLRLKQAISARRG